MTQSDSAVRVLRGRFGLAVCALGVVSVLACPAGDSGVRNAQETFTQTLQTDSNHAAYGLALLAKSQTPFAHETIAGALRADHAQTAREAVKAIVDSPPESTREALRGVFETKGGLLKLNAAQALANLGDPEALEFVSQETLSGGATLSAPIARLIAEGPRVDELKAIMAKRMASEDKSLRDEACGLLGEIQQPWATSLLLTGLGKERGEDRQQAIMSLGRSGDPAVAPELHGFVNTQGLVFATLEALGELGNPASLETVKKMTDHEEPLVRVVAAAAAWKLGDEATALAVLGPLATDEDQRVRLNVAQQVRQIEGPAATDLLRGLLADEDHSVRLEAIRGLADRAEPGMEALFVDALADKSYEVSTSALDALAQIGGTASLEPIQAQLVNQNPYVVMSAANAFLEIKNRVSPGAA